MNVPKNHHYVSQCHVKKFFNEEEGKIYLYDKILNNFFEKKSTKRIFSEDYSNTKISDGQIDHHSLENDLKKHFENSFNKNFNVITDIALNPGKPNEAYLPALIELTKYGLLKESRPPQEKKKITDLFNDVLHNKLLSNAAPALKNELEQYLKNANKIKYINEFDYSIGTTNILKEMGGLNFVITKIQCNHFFILPDCASMTRRARINDYFNPEIKNVAIVGTPLSSKFFLESISEKYAQVNDKIRFLTEKSANLIEEINYFLYLNAHKFIACENKDYLKKFIGNIKNLEKMFNRK